MNYKELDRFFFPDKNDFLESLKISQGELNGISKEGAFVLGVEYMTSISAAFMQRSSSTRNCVTLINTANKERIGAALEKRGFTVTFMDLGNGTTHMRCVDDQASHPGVKP